MGLLVALSRTARSVFFRICVAESNNEYGNKDLFVFILESLVSKDGKLVALQCNYYTTKYGFVSLWNCQLKHSISSWLCSVICHRFVEGCMESLLVNKALESYIG